MLALKASPMIRATNVTCWTIQQNSLHVLTFKFGRKYTRCEYMTKYRMEFVIRTTQLGSQRTEDGDLHHFARETDDLRFPTFCVESIGTNKYKNKSTKRVDAILAGYLFSSEENDGESLLQRHEMNLHSTCIQLAFRGGEATFAILSQSCNLFTNMRYASIASSKRFAHFCDMFQQQQQ